MFVRGANLVVRREAKRHAAFASRTTERVPLQPFPTKPRAPPARTGRFQGGVALCLPPHYKAPPALSWLPCFCTLRGTLWLCALVRGGIASHGVHGVRGGMGGCLKMVKLYGKGGVARAFLRFLFFMLGIGCGKTVEFFSH